MRGLTNDEFEALLLSFGVLNDPDEMKKYKTTHSDNFWEEGAAQANDFFKDMRAQGVPILPKSRFIQPTV